jgi:hypothetical protein
MKRQTVCGGQCAVAGVRIRFIDESNINYRDFHQL